MHLIEIANREIRLDLTPEDALLLEAACWEAAGSFLERQPEPVAAVSFAAVGCDASQAGMYLEALAAMFAAAAVACVATHAVRSDDAPFFGMTLSTFRSRRVMTGATQ